MNATIKLLRNSSAALRGARSVAYPSGMSQSLRAARLASELLATVTGDVR